MSLSPMFQIDFSQQCFFAVAVTSNFPVFLVAIIKYTYLLMQILLANLQAGRFSRVNPLVQQCNPGTSDKI
jgi:hypothetical protein